MTNKKLVTVSAYIPDGMCRSVEPESVSENRHPVRWDVKNVICSDLEHPVRRCMLRVVFSTFLTEYVSDKQTMMQTERNCLLQPLQVGCKKCGFLFSKIRSKKVVAKNPYFQKAPLIVNESMPVFTLITFVRSLRLVPLFLTDKGIRGDEKGTNDLLLRELSKNKGLMRKKNEH